MSQKKRLTANIDYLERFVSDMTIIKKNIESRYTIKSYDQACDEVFASVREIYQARISKLLEADDTALAQTTQNFANQILKVIADIKQNNLDNIEKNKHQVSLLEEIIDSSANSRDALLSQIVEEEQVQKDNIITEPPPIRNNPAVDLPTSPIEEKVKF